MNVLLVDDDSGIRKSLSQFIRGVGHNLVEASNGIEALEVLAENNSIQLVLSDIRMPRMGGLDLLEKIKGDDELKELTVILFTGFGEIKDAVDAMRMGAYDYLLKPIDVKELAIILERIGEYLALKEENRKLSKDFKNTVDQATKEIREELTEVRKAYAREVGVAEIHIFSDKLEKVFKTAKRLHGKREMPVLIEGETGTGKELVARYIHFGDGDVTTPFVPLNCAAITSTLFESELFGYEPGAFTGARPKGQKGKVEMAEGGTLFLDEIGEMTFDHQAKILRLLQEKEYYKVGGLTKKYADVRIVCATNRDLKQMVAEGEFRQDLYFRLNVGHVRIPALRERREEIVPLAESLLQKMHRENRTQFSRISGQAAKILTQYDWPGNVRELQSVIQRATLLYDGEQIEPSHLEFLGHGLPMTMSSSAGDNGGEATGSIEDVRLPEEGLDLNAWVLEIVRRALDKNQWNKTDTARYLGITRGVLYNYLKHFEKEK